MAEDDDFSIFVVIGDDFAGEFGDSVVVLAVGLASGEADVGADFRV